MGFVKLNISNQISFQFLINHPVIFHFDINSFLTDDRVQVFGKINRDDEKRCKTFISNFVSELFVILLKVKAVFK